jgi:hypothetical protein
MLLDRGFLSLGELGPVGCQHELADVLGGCGMGLVSGNSGRKSSSFPGPGQARNPDVIDSSPGMSKADRKAVSACSEGPLAALPAGHIILVGGLGWFFRITLDSAA